jgi:hypothetical protein
MHKKNIRNFIVLYILCLLSVTTTTYFTLRTPDSSVIRFFNDEQIILTFCVTQAILLDYLELKNNGTARSIEY